MFRDEPEHHRSVATLATRLCKVFGFVKRNLSGAQRRKDAASRVKGCGEGGGSPLPASAHSAPGALLRSGIEDTTRPWSSHLHGPGDTQSGRVALPCTSYISKAQSGGET